MYNCELFFNKDFIYLFLEKGEGKEKEGNINVWLLLMCPLLGSWPATQACALTGNRTDNPMVYRPVLSLLSSTSQGTTVNFVCSQVSCTSGPFFLSTCSECAVNL